MDFEIDRAQAKNSGEHGGDRPHGCPAQGCCKQLVPHFPAMKSAIAGQPD
jgi:hypothetical protein